MQKRTPTLGNLLVIVTFVLACFGLFLFLWYSFGGSVPLRPKGYRIHVEFPNGRQLAEQSEVRISGVPIGRVVSVREGSGMADALLEIDSRYAPLPRSMHAALREKTLLGEAYVQLLPHGGSGPSVPDEGRLPRSNVEPSTTLDQVLETFDPRTRAAFRRWQQSWANAFRGRGEDINAFFAELEPFTIQTNRILRLLAAQEGALSALIRESGTVFSALAGRRQQLTELIVSGERTFQAAAQASSAFAAAFRVIPAFEHSSTAALKELDSFATDANPYLVQFRASERALTPALRELRAFAPPLKRLMIGLNAWSKASQRGLPAFDRSLALTKPLLGELTPVLRDINPLFKYLGEYEPELQSFFANATAASNAHSGSEVFESANKVQLHYLRAMSVLSPEGLAVYQQPLGVSRSNPYFHPGAFNLLAGGLPVFSAAGCANSAPALSGPENEFVSGYLIAALRGEKFEVVNSEGVKEAAEIPPTANRSSGEANRVAAPACRQQEPFTIEGKTSSFPQVSP